MANLVNRGMVIRNINYWEEWQGWGAEGEKINTNLSSAQNI
jgi:hypothetical protein